MSGGSVVLLLEGRKVYTNPSVHNCFHRAHYNTLVSFSVHYGVVNFLSGFLLVPSMMYLTDGESEGFNGRLRGGRFKTVIRITDVNFDLPYSFARNLCVNSMLSSQSQPYLV